MAAALGPLRQPGTGRRARTTARSPSVPDQAAHPPPPQRGLRQINSELRRPKLSGYQDYLSARGRAACDQVKPFLRATDWKDVGNQI